MSSTAVAEDSKFTSSLDKAINWADPLALKASDLDSIYQEQGYKESPIFSWSKDHTTARFGEHPYSNVSVNCGFLGELVPVSEAQIVFADNVASKFTIDTRAVQLDEKVSAALTAATKVSAMRLSEQRESWSTDKYVVYKERTKSGRIRVSIVAPGEFPEPLIEQTGTGYQLTAEMDFMLDFDKLWQTTPAELEARFVAPGFQRTPFFEWLGTEKTRARFSSKPASNVSVAISFFQGRVPADEVIINFAAGRVASLQVSLYNRGDSGDITVQGFETRYKTAGSGFSSLLKVQARPVAPVAGAAVKTVGYRWDAPNCIAMLEHNEFGKGTKSTQPEFLRLRMASPKAADWSMGVKGLGATTTTVSRASLVKNVTKESNGDVYIKGVPMVDQGQKGYCVAASCQRLFEYFHIPCDQHEIAQLAETSADGGTNSRMYEATLDKIDNKFKTRFKPLYSRYNREVSARMNEVKFAKEIKDAVDAGLPLLWSLELGLVAEEPPLTGVSGGVGAGQGLGGHMRMVIGYNEQTGKVLYTDSWGAGHELKRMDMAPSFQATHGLYLLLPKTL